MSPDSYLRMRGKTREELIEESKPEAEAEHHIVSEAADKTPPEKSAVAPSARASRPSPP